MAKYRVTKESFIANAIRKEGDIVDYDGIPADNLEPLDKPAEVAAAQSDEATAESLARQQVAAAGGDPDTVTTLA